eukprot:s1455_g3.t1
MSGETREGTTSSVPTQLTTLVPSFDPAKDDLEQYVQKIEMLAEIWPAEKLNELATRLILNTTGAAFQKLQLQKSEILTNDKKGIENMVKALGGHWGKVTLERKYEVVEKALFRCTQKSDESNDSYLARTDIYWTELLAKKMSMEELRSYIILRGSLLSQEDKKRVILESDAAGTGQLSMDKVNQSVRMLGSGFFHEMIGMKKSKGRIYDAANVTTDETDDASWDATALVSEEYTEEDMVEALAHEGDEDALFISDYESAMLDALQDDSELATAYSAYTDARKRLSERFRNRGFWPSSFAAKGKGKGNKGKFKGSSKGFQRKSLQQRMLETSCRLCGRRGHWKAECPDRNKHVTSSASTTAPTMTAEPTESSLQNADDFLPLEFLQLPEIQEAALDEPKLHTAFVSMINLRGKRSDLSKPTSMPDVRVPAPVSMLAHDELAMFSSHETFGILDTGATKSVIGSDLIPDLIKGLNPKIRQRLSRCKCSVTFRFGNQGTLDSNSALVIPIGNLGLKISIVQGQTPLLLSNTLLRTLKAQVDIAKQCLQSPLLKKPIKLHLNSRGLFLLDVNDLAESASTLCNVAETFSHVDIRTEPENAKTAPHAEQPPVEQGQEVVSQGPLGSRQVTEIPKPLQLIHPPIPIMSLSKRLESLKTGAYADQVAEFKALPWDAMCNTKIDFGKAHMGKTYLTVWHTEPGWVRWVVKTYEGSQKAEHQKFLTFVELMIEMEEKGATPTSINVETIPDQMPIHAAKAKCKPKSRPAPVNEDLLVHLDEADVEEWMEMPSDENTEMITALQARMGFLENAMTEVLNHIRQSPQ